MRTHRLLGIGLLALVGSACGDPSTQAALRVVTTFNFKAGCVTVKAVDALNSATPNEFQLALSINASPSAPVDKTFAVFREKEWSNQLQVTTTAYENTCGGAVVAQKVWTESLPETGVKETRVQLFATDLDGDGFVAQSNPVFPGTDCDDSDLVRFPGNAETCDGKDNDCANGVDDGLTFVTYYQDQDGDTYGATSTGQTTCGAQPAGTITRGGDCDDTGANAAVRTPGSAEICDGIDNDCDAQALVDNGLTFTNYYVDADGDGFGVTAQVSNRCADPGNGYSTTGGDCQDTGANAALRAPGKAEICDGIDNDCDAAVPLASQIDETVKTLWFVDTDNDGWRNGTTNQVTACSTDATDNVTPPYKKSAGSALIPSQTISPWYTTNTGTNDCDNADPVRFPGNPEICDGKDNDCDAASPTPAQIDEGVATTPYYLDFDVDGYGDASVRQDKCAQPSGYVANSTDCDDTVSTTHPNAPELCDTVDNNCGGGTDEGITVGTACTGTGGCSGTLECYPGNTTTQPACNAPPLTQWYADADGDGVGAATGPNQCTNPGAGFSDVGGDCDDGNPWRKPGFGTELCDGIDNNCLPQPTPTADEGITCTPDNWSAMTVGGGADDWETVAVDDYGGASNSYPVWIAGAGDRLNVKIDRTNPGVVNFTTRNGICGGANWNSSYVEPVNNWVLLAGDSGKLAGNDSSTTCLTTSVGGTSPALSGIWGYENGSGNVISHIVAEDGTSYTWTLPANTVASLAAAPAAVKFYDVHGIRDATGTFLIAVGSDTAGTLPKAYKWTGSGSWVAINPPGTALGQPLRAVWVVNRTLAWAVGDGGLVLRFNGTGWDPITATNQSTGNYTSVIAFGANLAYAVEDGGSTQRFNDGAWTNIQTAAGNLRDIAGAQPNDLWTTGINGKAYHLNH